MIKACSFLPAVSQMIYDMGLQQHLLGVTFECPEIARKEKYKVLNSVFENHSFSSKEIDEIFSSYKNEGTIIYSMDEQRLLQINPDVVFTQDLCDVCMIDTHSVEKLIHAHKLSTEIVSMSPNNMDEVMLHAILIGEKLGAKNQAQAYVKAQQDKINIIQDCLSKAPVKTITLLEWFDPIYNCGHWIPDQIQYAKGRDLLSNPHGNSYRVNINELIINDPEYILIAPCGFTIERTLQEIQVLTELPLWSSLQAVKNQQVYVLPYEYFTQSSLSTLVHGIEILAAVLHPTFYEPSVALKNKIHRLIH